MKEIHPQVSSDTHSILQTPTAPHNGVNDRRQDGYPSYSLYRWFNGNNDPFTMTVGQESHDKVASIVAFFELENEMQRDAKRIIEPSEVIFGTLF
jgi:hypothetical protein